MHTNRGSNGHCLSIVYFKQSLSHMYTCLSYSHISAFYNDFVEVFVIIKKGEIVGQLALLMCSIIDLVLMITSNPMLFDLLLSVAGIRHELNIIMNVLRPCKIKSRNNAFGIQGSNSKKNSAEIDGAVGLDTDGQIGPPEND